MFELPEVVTLAGQINTTLTGKTVAKGRLGNSPHKFVWYNRSHDEFESLTYTRTVGTAWAKGRWLFIPLEPDYLLVLGECGGRVLYHAPNAKTPAKYHLLVEFDDGSSFSAMTQMWGAMELYVRGEEQNRQYIKDMRPTPTEAAFTFDYFGDLLEALSREKSRSAKGLLTQEQIIPGLGNAIAQDILFLAHLRPQHPLGELSQPERRALYDAIVGTVQEAIRCGGRYDEYDLFNQPGGYVRLMDSKMVGRPCPRCGTEITKIQYLGGACYFCPTCQE